MNLFIIPLFILIAWSTNVIAAYTLVDKDVQVENGVITECTTIFKDANIVIPKLLKGQTIFAISDKISQNGVFENKGISSVILPSTLLKIGSYAFSKNSLTKITLPKGLEIIGIGAFTSNNLDSVKLPATIIHLGKNVFSKNKLNRLTLPVNTIFKDSLDYMKMWVSSSGTFHQNGSRLTNLTLGYQPRILYTLSDSDVVVQNGSIMSTSIDSTKTDILIPQKLDGQIVIAIANQYDSCAQCGVFANKGLHSVKLPITLKEIGAFGFYNNQLKKINFPDSLVLIGQMALNSNPLTNVVFPDSKIKKGYLLSKIWLSDKGTIHTYGDTLINFSPAYSVKMSYILTDDDVSINKSGLIYKSNYGFYAKNLIIPNILHGKVVKGVADAPAKTHGVFSRKNLFSVKFSNQITYIGDDSFSENLLSSIDFPKNLFLIGVDAFYQNNLEYIRLPARIKEIWNGAFSKNKLAFIKLPFQGNQANWLDDDKNIIETNAKVINFESAYILSASSQNDSESQESIDDPGKENLTNNQDDYVITEEEKALDDLREKSDRVLDDLQEQVDRRLYKKNGDLSNGHINEERDLDVDYAKYPDGHEK